MLGRTSALLLALVGCDRVWGLDDVATVDAAHAPCRDPGLTGDEDGDRDVDGCDPCPADPEASDVDSDGDRIDDVCDPHPQTPGDRIVLFDSMATDLKYTTDMAAWLHEGGQYQTTLHVTSRSMLAIDPTTGPTVDAIFASIEGQGVNPIAGVTLTLGPTTVVDCAYEEMASPLLDQLVIRINNSVVQTMPFTITTSMRFHLTQNADGSIDCTGDTATASATVHNPALAGTVATAFGFVTVNTIMKINSVTVFGTN